MNNLPRTLARLLLVLAVPLALAGCGINEIPRADERVKSAWGDVQNQYQRRAELIPNLVATVERFAQQEQAVLTQVIQARASATQVQVDASTITDPAALQRYQAAQDQLSGVLGRMMLTFERYPELSSNRNFLVLQDQIEGAENRIAIARRDYNEAVRAYNTTLRVFPTVLWAKTIHSSNKPAVPFAASGAAQTAPTVTFQPPAGLPSAAPPPAVAPPGAPPTAPPGPAPTGS